MRLLAEVRRRGILKLATAYLAVSWLTLEIGHTLFNIFELPHAGLQFIFVLLALGFPIALLGTWNGWFASLVTDANAFPQSNAALAGHGSHPEQSAEHSHGGHEGPLLAVVFGVVALIAVAIAIGIRFFGMADSPASHGAHASPATERSQSSAEPAATVSPVAAPPFDPPAHSIAVLPFVNMSGDAAQEYFSDGLSEELLNSLVRINQLQVAARTSSFSFKGQKIDISEIGHKLNVHSVLEGSVRKDGRRVRITAQLINAVTGFHLWSETYDRDLKDVLRLQTDIATAVTSALRAELLGTEASLIEAGGTKNPQAFDAFLRAERAMSGQPLQDRVLTRIAELDEAIRLDPQYAKAYARRATWKIELAVGFDTGSAINKRFADARADAEKAVALAPTLGIAQMAMSRVLSTGFRDFAGADRAIRRAVAVAGGDAEVLGVYAGLSASWTHFDDAVNAAQRAVVLDPLTARRYRRLSQVLISARRYPEALEAIDRAMSLDPKLEQSAATRCHALYGLGQFEAARQSCLLDSTDWYARTMLATTLYKLNRQDEARSVFSKLVAEIGDAAAFQYAEIYAQWNDIPKALDALDTAYAANDPGVIAMKEDFLLDPLRDEPRFKAIVRKLNFPP